MRLQRCYIKCFIIISLSVINDDLYQTMTKLRRNASTGHERGRNQKMIRPPLYFGYPDLQVIIMEEQTPSQTQNPDLGNYCYAFSVKADRRKLRILRMFTAA